VTVATTNPADLVENPEFLKWAKARVGTVVVHRTTTTTDGVKETTTSTTETRVKEIAENQIVLVTTTSMVRHDGFRTDDPPETVKIPRLVTLPPGVKREQFGQMTVTRTDTVTACGKTLKCRVISSKDRSDAGSAEGETWVSEEVPGGLVKSVRRIENIRKTNTIELVKWE
jgi:hypothetical protein